MSSGATANEYQPEVSWEGVPFLALYHHDARTVRLPGLFAFVRRSVSGERSLLFVDHADCIAQVATPNHELWSEARWHGMNEVHVCLTARERIDRLQLRAHLLRRLQPLLNRASEGRVAEPLMGQMRAGEGLRRAV
jgi:hypothetical protein